MELNLTTVNEAVHVADVWGYQFKYKSLSMRGLYPPTMFNVALLERVCLWSLSL